MSILIFVLLAFLASLLLGLAIIPVIIRFCIKHRLFDEPNARKVHRNAIPRLGGICFLPIAMIALLGVMFYDSVGGYMHNSSITVSLWTVSFFISLAIIYILGFVDDIVGLDAKLKFGVQTFAAAILPLTGLKFYTFGGLLGIGELNCVFGFLFSVFVIVFICNAINLIDGIDGLSAGLAIISLVGFLVLFMSAGVETYSVLIAAFIGVLCAYLRFNLFGSEKRRTKIFMGDAGSLSVGFILAFLLLKATAPYPVGIMKSDGILISACSFLVVPVFDVIRVSLARLSHKRGIFSPDKNHIHHKLLRTGMNQYQALVTILAFAIFVIVVDAVLVDRVNPNVILALDVLLWLVFNWHINKAIRKRGKEPFLMPE